MYYHISKTDLGYKPILEPRLPDSAIEEIEGTNKRVCFGPSINNCLISIFGHKNPSIYEMLDTYKDGNNPAIYVTHKKLILPPDVSDFRYTGEMWSLEDIEVKKHSYLCLDKLSEGIISTTLKPITVNIYKLQTFLDVYKILRSSIDRSNVDGKLIKGTNKCSYLKQKDKDKYNLCYDEIN